MATGRGQTWLEGWDGEELTLLQNLVVKAYVQAAARLSPGIATDDAPGYADGEAELSDSRPVPADFPEKVLRHLEKVAITLGGVTVSLDDDVLYFTVRRSFSEMGRSSLLALTDDDIAWFAKKDTESLAGIYTDYKKLLFWAVGGAPGDAEGLAKDLEEILRRYFPRSLCKASFGTNLLSSITVYFSLVDAEDNLPWRIRDNDPAYTVWTVYGMDSEGNLEQKLVMTACRGTTLSVNPEPETHMAMGRVKFGWRNKTGTREQILKHFEAYVAKSKEIMRANQDQIYGTPEQVEIYKTYINT